MDTGRIYYGAEVAAALERGERVLPLGSGIAVDLDCSAPKTCLLETLGVEIVDREAAVVALEGRAAREFARKVEAGDQGCRLDGEFVRDCIEKALLRA